MKYHASPFLALWISNDLHATCKMVGRVLWSPCDSAILIPDDNSMKKFVISINVFTVSETSGVPVT